MKLLAELKRRNVYRAAIAYLVIAWLLLQVADVVFGIIGTPSWVQQSILAVLAIGFPIAIMLAWVFELTPEGLRREEDADSTARKPRRGISDRALMGLFAVAVVLFVDEFWLDCSRTVALATGPTIAVLPFTNLSPDPANEYLADGLAAELLNLLASIPGFKVAAPTSSFAFRGRNIDVKDIAEQLGVAYVLSGSVRQSGDVLRITAHLSEAADGYHVWSNSWESEIRDIFEIQDEISTSVADAMRVRLVGGTVDRERADPQAYVLYVQSGEALRARLEPVVAGDTSSRLERALALVMRSIAIDPEFAPAWGRLAEIHFQRAQWMYDDPSEVYELAIAAAERALSIDSRQTAALVVLGHVDRLWRWDSVAAAKKYREALDINPLDVETLIAIDVLFAKSGLPEPAIFEKVFELDPLNPRPIINHALNLWNAGDFDGGREFLDMARLISPDAVKLVGIESMFDYWEGNYESVIRSGRDVAPVPYVCALRALGRTAEADAELQRARDSNSDLLVVAALQSCAGDLDAAFDALERTYDEHNHRLHGMRQNLYFRPPHDDERWANLLERVGLSDDIARRVQGVFADAIPAS